MAALLTGLILAIGGAAANATPFNFGVTYNGSVVTVDATSDTINQTVLNPGDSFKINVKAAENDYFEVADSFESYLGATFLVQDMGVRTGNILTSFLLDGNVVAQMQQLNVQQTYSHLGLDVLLFSAGLLFDELTVDYSFLTSTASHTTIQATDDVFFPISYVFYPPGVGNAYAGAFYKSPFIAYHDATTDAEPPETSVPEPVAVGLLSLAIAMLGYVQRRKRRPG